MLLFAGTVKAKNADRSKHSIEITTTMAFVNRRFEYLAPNRFFLKGSFISLFRALLGVLFLPSLFALTNFLYLGRAWDEYWRGAGGRSQQYEFLR